ncbi:MAG: hypothetical protein WDW38_009351 [Sanguina aurantia]
MLQTMNAPARTSLSTRTTAILPTVAPQQLLLSRSPLRPRDTPPTIRCQSANNLAVYSLAAFSPVPTSLRPHSSTSHKGSSPSAPHHPAPSISWLAASLPRIVEHTRISDSSVVHLVHAGAQLTLQSVAVQGSSASESPEWPRLSREVHESSADGLIFVRRIPTPNLACSVAACNNIHPSPAPHSTSTSPPSPPSPFTSKSSSPLPTQLEGKVGDCCDHLPGPEHAPAHTSPLSSPSLGLLASHQAHHVTPHAHPSPASSVGDTEQYFGLVVQGRGSSQPLLGMLDPASVSADGCYVLKTSSVGQDGCRCTHFTLTRVCQGHPLAEQLRDSWLCAV